MSGDVSPYTALITSEHQGAAKFLAGVAASVQAFADAMALLKSMPALYDLDFAIGVQLDAVGLWIGRTRYLTIPIANVFFTWDTVGLGWDHGIWRGPFDPGGSITALGDALYRRLLKATVIANHWDGSVPQLYTDLDALFSPLTVTLNDNQNMTMVLILTGAADNVTKALFTSGALGLRPVGVSATYSTSP